MTIVARKRYCCDASRLAFENYYISQAGGASIPIFRGSRNQRGHGIGSVLGGLFRSAVPILKKGFQKIAPTALKTGLTIAGDVLEGRNLKEAARSRVSEGIKNLIEDEQPLSSSRQSQQQHQQKQQQQQIRQSRPRKRRKLIKKGQIF